MKITFSNLGRIKKAELDLRPLTIIIGPNNANKTYIAYSVYGIFQRHYYLQLVPKPEKSLDFPKMSFPTDEVSKYLQLSFKQAVRDFQSELEIFFQDSSQKLFSSTRLELNISPEEIKTAISGLHDKEIQILTDPEIKVKLIVDENFTLSFFQENNEINLLEKHFKKPEEIQHLARSILSGWINNLFFTPFALPAERNAFIITYKMLATRRYRMLRDTQREFRFARQKNDKLKRQAELLREQGDLRYPKPIEDFLDFLADAEFDSEQTKTNKRAEFQKLAENIEKWIQSGNQTYYRKTPLGGKELRVKIENGLDIDLYNASSSIKQLAPLLLFLRYRAAENQLLIIDEPEMNLHPESQAKLLEALAVLVNLGVKVLITTHSPYFLAHLNNLVNNNTDPAILKRQATALYSKDSRAFLPDDKVSAYEMREVGAYCELHSLKDEEYGIRWDTLSDVSVELQQKFFEIDKKGRTFRNEKK